VGDVDTHWQLQEAKQRLSQVIRDAHADGPQYVTRHGEEVAVIVDIDEYRRLTGGAHDLKRYLVDRTGTAELDIARSTDTGRDVDLTSVQ
jgi:prevent-host-death family protein